MKENETVVYNGAVHEEGIWLPVTSDEEEKEEVHHSCPCQDSNPPNKETPVKSLAHDRSLDSLNQEFEEEVVEIDCGVVDTKANSDIQCKVCWDNTSTAENPLLNSC